MPQALGVERFFRCPLQVRGSTVSPPPDVADTEAPGLSGDNDVVSIAPVSPQRSSDEQLAPNESGLIAVGVCRMKKVTPASRAACTARMLRASSHPGAGAPLLHTNSRDPKVP